MPIPNLLATLASVSSQQSFAAGWGTLAMLTAGVAQGKNRSGLVWFLASLLAGPIATLILVLVDKLRHRRNDRAHGPSPRTWLYRALRTILRREVLYQPMPHLTSKTYLGVRWRILLPAYRLSCSAEASRVGGFR